MKFTKKECAKIATKCDKHFFVYSEDGQQKFVALDRKEDILAYIKHLGPLGYPMYIYPSSILTVDELEDSDVFSKKCRFLGNMSGDVYVVEHQESSQRFTYLSRSSRSALKNILKSDNCDEIYVFGASPVTVAVTPLSISKVTDRCVQYDEDDIIYYGLASGTFEYEASKTTLQKFASQMFSDDPKTVSAVRNGHVYDKYCNVPVSELLFLPPWELYEKYPNIVLIPALKGRVKWKGIHRLYECTRISEYNNTITKFFNSNTSYYALCAVTEESYKSLHRIMPLDTSIISEDKEVIIDETGKVLRIENRSIKTLEDVVAMLCDNNITSSTLFAVHTNNAMRKHNDLSRYVLTESLWYMTVVQHNAIFPTTSVIEMLCTTPATVRALESVGCDVKIYQQALRLKHMVSFDNCNFAFDNLVDMCCYACISKHSDNILSSSSFRDAIYSRCVSKVIQLLCVFYALGYCRSEIAANLDLIMRGELLYSEFVYRKLLATDKSNVAIVQGNEHLFVIINSLCEKLDDASTCAGKFIDGNLRYIRLMLPKEAPIPIENMFLYSDLSTSTVCNY